MPFLAFLLRAILLSLPFLIIDATSQLLNARAEANRELERLTRERDACKDLANLTKDKCYKFEDEIKALDEEIESLYKQGKSLTDECQSKLSKLGELKAQKAPLDSIVSKSLEDASLIERKCVNIKVGTIYAAQCAAKKLAWYNAYKFINLKVLLYRANIIASVISIYELIRALINWYQSQPSETAKDEVASLRKAIIDSPNKDSEECYDTPSMESLMLNILNNI
jgi:seryl-tRNA synthetase